jgi:hypothetical protein
MTGIDFERLGFTLMPGGIRHLRRNAMTRNRRFKAWFGTDALHCLLLWNLLIKTKWTATLKSKPQPKHLLWALLFLRNYSIEEVHASQVGGVDEKTFRKWAWFYIEGIASLVPLLVSETALLLV